MLVGIPEIQRPVRAIVAADKGHLVFPQSLAHGLKRGRIAHLKGHMPHIQGTSRRSNGPGPQLFQCDGMVFFSKGEKCEASHLFGQTQTEQESVKGHGPGKIPYSEVHMTEAEVHRPVLRFRAGPGRNIHSGFPGMIPRGGNGAISATGLGLTGENAVHDVFG